MNLFCATLSLHYGSLSFIPKAIVVPTATPSVLSGKKRMQFFQIKSLLFNSGSLWTIHKMRTRRVHHGDFRRIDAHNPGITIRSISLIKTFKHPKSDILMVRIISENVTNNTFICCNSCPFQYGSKTPQNIVKRSEAQCAASEQLSFYLLVFLITQIISYLSSTTVFFSILPLPY